MLRSTGDVLKKISLALVIFAGLAACAPMSTAHAEGAGLDRAFSEESSPVAMDDVSANSLNSNQACAISSAYNVDGTRVQVCQLVNSDRANYGLNGLQIDPALSLVAQAFAQDMYTRGYFSHVTPSGETMEDRMNAGGVKFGWAGENIARGQASPTDVNISWMNSPGHRANILQTHYRKVGVGRVGNVWVEEFSD